MIKLTRLTDDFSISGQLDIADVAQVSSLGFHSIICNRPDGEDISQPLFADIAAKAEIAGLGIRYVPIPRKGPSPEDIVAFSNAYNDLPKPILAYTETGQRSHAMFEHAFAKS